jgi:hypothetical protein
MYQANLIKIAMLMSLTPLQAVYLPTTFEVAANKTGLKKERLANLCIFDQEAREIIKNVIIESQSAMAN